MSGELPIYDYYEVLDYKTLLKTRRVWVAVVKIKPRDGDRVSIALYKWEVRKGSWKRHSKIVLSPEVWRTLKETMEAWK